MTCTACELGSLEGHMHAIIFANYEGKWILCNHRDRATWETSGGHIEPGETPLEAAKRELFEETGVVEYTIHPVCDYRAWAEPQERANLDWVNAIGQVFLAVVDKIGPLPESEIKKIDLFEELPENLTYPAITHEVFPIARKLFESGGF